MRIGSRAAMAAVILLISGCGGSDESSSGSGSVTIPPVTPTPSPTPGPTLSPAYPTFTSLDASWTATGPFVYSEVVAQGGTPYDILKVHIDFPSGMIIEAKYTGSPTDNSAYFADFIRSRFSNFTQENLEIKNELGAEFQKSDEKQVYETFSMGTPFIDDYQYTYLAPLWIGFSYPSGSIDPFGSKEINEQKRVGYNTFFGQKTEHSDFPTVAASYQSYGVLYDRAAASEVFIGLGQSWLHFFPEKKDFRRVYS